MTRAGDEIGCGALIGIQRTLVVLAFDKLDSASFVVALNLHKVCRCHCFTLGVLALPVL